VAKLVLIGAVPPLMLKTAANPDGVPMEVFDGFRQSLAANRAQFYRDVASGPFYGYNRPGANVSPAVVDNWWRQGMMGGAKAHYDGIKAFSETDFTADLKIVDVPTLVMHGNDDQVVPIATSALLSAKLLKRGTLKIYDGLSHGMCTTHPDLINRDLLAFVTGG
jgi:non-heme chloroperoxidase